MFEMQIRHQLSYMNFQIEINLNFYVCINLHV